MSIQYPLHALQQLEPLGLERLTELLETSQRRSAEYDITGFLHVEGRNESKNLENQDGAAQHTVERIRNNHDTQIL